MNVNSSIKYGAAVLVEGSNDATNVIRRVPFAIKLSSVGHVAMAVDIVGGVYVYEVILAASNCKLRSLGLALSEFTNSTVTTIKRES